METNQPTMIAPADALAAVLASPTAALFDRDLRAAVGSIDLSQFGRRSPEREALDRGWNWHGRMMIDAPGIAIRCNLDAWGRDGEIVVERAMVSSVEEFLEHWGAPVTHARAQEIAETRLAELPGTWRDESEEQLEKLHAEDAREAYELRSV